MWDNITALRLLTVSHCQEWQGWRWITIWKSCPTFSSSYSELINFLTQNLPSIYLSVETSDNSSSRVQSRILPTSKGNRKLYLWSFYDKTAKVPSWWYSHFNLTSFLTRELRMGNMSYRGWWGKSVARSIGCKL